MEPEPLLSVDATDGCRKRSMPGADTVLCQGVEDNPAVAVCPPQPMCRLEGPHIPGEGRLSRGSPVHVRSSSLGIGESGDDANGATESGILAVRSWPGTRVLCVDDLTLS